MNATAFEWQTTTAFEGKRVSELRRRMATPAARPSARIRAMMANLRAQGPVQVSLIALFGLLTVADIFFNMSRGILCSLPGGLCEAASDWPA